MASKKLQFANGRLLNQLHCGKTENLEKAERAFGVELLAREDWLLIEGPAEDVDRCEEFFSLLKLARDRELAFRNGDFERVLELFSACSPQPAGDGAAVQRYDVATEKVEQYCSLPDSWNEIESFAREVLGG